MSRLGVVPRRGIPTYTCTTSAPATGPVFIGVGVFDFLIPSIDLGDGFVNRQRDARRPAVSGQLWGLTSTLVCWLWPESSSSRMSRSEESLTVPVCKAATSTR